MRIINFLRQLVPSFTKDDVKEKLRLISQALQQSIACYTNANEVLGKPTFKSKAGKDFDSAFKRSVKVQYRGTPSEIILQILLNISGISDLLGALIDKSYNKDIVVEGITYKRAEILRILGFMDFTVTYSRQMLHYLLVAEANVQAKTLTPGAERPKPELAFLEANQETFFRLLNTFAQADRDIVKKIDDIPDIGVGENDEITIVPTVGINRLDPLKSNFIPGITPMFMGFGIWWAQIQVARYERMKEDVRTIEYRVEQLRLQAQGKEDAVLEKSIKKYEEYLNDLAEKIAKMEKKYA